MALLKVFAENGDTTPIADVGTLGEVNFSDGFTLDYEKDLNTDPSAKAIDRKQTNYLFKKITEQIKQFMSVGTPIWDATVSYEIGARVSYLGENYTARVATTNSLPTTTTNWEVDVSSIELALKAPLASPAFTDIPTAPTAVIGTNNTQVATTAFVGSAILAEALTPATQLEVDEGVVPDKFVAPNTLKSRLRTFQLADGVGNLAILLKFTVNSTIARGDIVAGSSLRYTGFGVYSTTSSYTYNGGFGVAPTGTWQAIGSTSLAQSSVYPANLFIRIA